MRPGFNDFDKKPADMGRATATCSTVFMSAFGAVRSSKAKRFAFIGRKPATGAIESMRVVVSRVADAERWWLWACPTVRDCSARDSVTAATDASAEGEEATTLCARVSDREGEIGVTRNGVENVAAGNGSSQAPTGPCIVSAVKITGVINEATPAALKGAAAD